MKTILYIITALLLLISPGIYAADVYTVSDGDWSDPAIWSSGNQPGKADKVYIYHTIVHDEQISLPLLSIEENASLLVSNNISVQKTCTLLVKSGAILETDILETFKGCHVYFYANSDVTVNQHYYNWGSSTDITIDGNLSISGNFDNAVNGLISGAGVICVGGNFDGAGTTFSYTPNSSIDNATCLNATLPVELIGFDADHTAGHVQLNWSTATESNNDYFEIQRSADGSDYEVLGVTKGAGNSNRVIIYDFTDKKPLQGLAYYRLRQVDYDGKYEYSPLVKVETIKKTLPLVNLYPNPVSGTKKLNILSDANINAVFVYDASGNVILSETSQNINQLDFSSADPGFYMLVLETDNGFVNKKLVVTDY